MPFTQDAGVAWERDGWFFATPLLWQNDEVCKEGPGRAPSLKDWIKQSFGDDTPVESPYVPGTFFKRIYRPSVREPLAVGHYFLGEATESFTALSILVSKLEGLFEFVTPSADTKHVYGHKIREILLLACMEVESSWSAVLKANGYSTANGRFSTTDYVKLRPAMFLDAYSINLPAYRNYPSLTPFEGWNAGKPTQSLPWYDVYNQTKHDREANLKIATLSHAIMAVSAAVVMTYAQFGFEFQRGGIDHHDLRVKSLLSPGINAFHPDFFGEMYLPEMVIGQMLLKPVPTGHWTAINYQF